MPLYAWRAGDVAETIPPASAAGEIPMLGFLAHFLFILAAWTVTIKFAFPVAYAVAQGVPIGSFVMWDFWWVVHLWLGWALLHWRRYTFALAAVVSVTEIVIVAVKLVLFLSAPQWTIWRTNWFINKLFVLACFILLLGVLATNAQRLRPWRGPAAPAAADTPARLGERAR
ncbi:MAG TPA: hypothetical protein VMH32_12960 [Burkholderiales bacterium]|nr:hypothetical protein [Burkholderiales bacterium]